MFCFEARPDVVFAFAPASSMGESETSASTRTARKNLVLPMAAPTRKYSTINTHLICSEREKFFFLRQIAMPDSSVYLTFFIKITLTIDTL
jgi:hypothetical protein